MLHHKIYSIQKHNMQKTFTLKNVWRERSLELASEGQCFIWVVVTPQWGLELLGCSVDFVLYECRTAEYGPNLANLAPIIHFGPTLRIFLWNYGKPHSNPVKASILPAKFKFFASFWAWRNRLIHIIMHNLYCKTITVIALMNELLKINKMYNISSRTNKTPSNFIQFEQTM